MLHLQYATPRILVDEFLHFEKNSPLKMDASDYSKMHGVDLSIHSLKTSDRITKYLLFKNRLFGGDSYLNGKLYKCFLTLLMFLSGACDGGSEVLVT